MKLALATTLVAIFLLASAEKSPPRKALPPPCEVQCLEAKNAALQKLAVKRLKLLGVREHRIVALLKRLRAEVDRRVHAPPAIPHRRGWLCIHNGAYPGAPHEGRGRNGPYTGPLQMTDPWMGNHAPGGSWDNESDDTIYAMAEREFRGTGYSRSWLSGQWPATYPPCAARF